MTDTIRTFMDDDDKKIEKLIIEYPVCLSTKAIAEFLGMDIAAVRAVIDNGVVGCSWKKTGKDHKGYYIPTAQFVRWYTLSRP